MRKVAYKRILIITAKGHRQHYKVRKSNLFKYAKISGKREYARLSKEDIAVSKTKRKVEEEGGEEVTSRIDAQEIHIYGALPTRKKHGTDKYRLIEITIKVNANVSPDDIRNYLDGIGVYSAFEQGDIASERKFDRRVTVAGEYKAIARGSVVEDWKAAIKKAVDNSKEREDLHRDFTRKEKKTVVANKQAHLQYEDKENKFYDDFDAR